MKELIGVESVDLSALMEEAGLEAFNQGNFHFAQSLLEGSLQEAENDKLQPATLISKLMKYATVCEINGCFDEALRAYEKILKHYLEDLVCIDDNLSLVMKNLSVLLKRSKFEDIAEGMEACAEVVQSLVFQHTATSGIFYFEEPDEELEQQVA